MQPDRSPMRKYIHVTDVVVLLQVSRTDDYEDRNIGASSQYSHMRRSHAPRRLPWSPQIAETDMAFAWSKCLAPVYAFNLIGIRAACKYKVNAPHHCALRCLLLD